jgi:hypothetical protein
MYGEQDIANRLYEDIPLEIKWQVVANLYGILIWSTNDNGAELMRTAENGFCKRMMRGKRQ